MARVVVNGAADRDVDEILGTIADGAGHGVAVVYDGAFDAFYRRLKTFPESGAPRLALGSGIRIGVIRPYVIIYRYDADSDVVEILRVLHGHRRMTSSLLPGEP